MFYCPNHSTRIVESGNARFIENSKVRGSVGARNVEIKESLMDPFSSSDPFLAVVPIAASAALWKYFGTTATRCSNST